MHSSRLVFLILMVITASQCSETFGTSCTEFDCQSFNLLEGEAFYFVPYVLPNGNVSDNNITWYKNDSQVISTDEEERVHYHGGALLFLNLTTEDTGFYTARHQTLGKCNIYPLKVQVFREGPSKNKQLLYRAVRHSGPKVQIPCPGYVSYTCKELHGKFTWEKDSQPLGGKRNRYLWVSNTKDNEGIYTCICTWKHNQNVYKSSGSRRLKVAPGDL